MQEKTLRVELVNENPYGGYYYVELKFPAKAHEIQDVQDRLRAQELPDTSLAVSVLECPLLPELAGARLDSPTFPELNYFAERLLTLDSTQQAVFMAVAPQVFRSGEDELVSIKDLINMTYGLDDVPVASNISTDEQLGQLVIESDMQEDVAAIPEQSLYLLDKRQIGKLQRENDGGVFIGDMYVAAGEYELPEIYDGEHLPQVRPSEPYAFRLLVSKTPEDRHTEWLNLPMSKEEIREFEAAHQHELPYFHCHDFESAIPQITGVYLAHMGRFHTLNDLAARIQAYTPIERLTFKAALEAEKPRTLNGVWDVANHVSEYELAETPWDADEFFKDYLSHHLAIEVDRKWLNSLDASDVEMRLLNRLGATETGYGILSARGRSLYELVPFEEPQAKELTTQRMTDEKLEVVEVLGQTALFTNGRVTQKALPEGLYCYDLRERESAAFVTVEPHVAVNHAGTILLKTPLDFSGQDYIALDNDSSLIFLGESMSMQEFMEADFSQSEDMEEQQMGGMLL